MVDWQREPSKVSEKRARARRKRAEALVAEVMAWREREAEVMAKLQDYNATDDFAKSIDEAYRVIRERMRNGGPGWTQKEWKR